MNINKIRENILHVTFKTQEELAKAFLPFQEFYENIKFAGTEFTFDEFKDWYIAEFGEFSYYQDWSGFNVPSSVIASMRNNDNLMKSLVISDESTKLYESLLPMLSDDFYVIGTIQDTDVGTLAHELSHARFFLDILYKQNVTFVLEKNSHLIEPLVEHLKGISYHQKVLLDEAHAYILHEEEYLTSEGLWNSNLAALREELRRLE